MPQPHNKCQIHPEERRSKITGRCLECKKLAQRRWRARQVDRSQKISITPAWLEWIHSKATP